MKTASYWMGLVATLAFLTQASGGVHVLAKETLGEREVLITPDYSRDKVIDRVTCDFVQPIDLSKVWGFTFEVTADDMMAFRSFVVLLCTGNRSKPTGWYVYRPKLFTESGDGWFVMTLSRQPASLLDAPEGFDKITCFRFTGYLRSGKRPKEVKFRGFRLLDAAPRDVDVHVRTADSLDKVCAIPAKAGERRLAWTHVETHGGEVPDWEAMAARAKRDGITDLIPLLFWNGGAYFPSAVTDYRKDLVEKHGDQLAKCLAACRRHGVKCHVWKVNYRLRGSKEMVARMRAENRLQLVRPGGNMKKPLEVGEWLCPSDPRNLKLESDAMYELAGKGVDGIHFDYIRHNGRTGCFCDGCRERFERRIGRKVENWPADVEPADAPLVKEWDEFRKDSISALVEDVAKRVRRDFPKVEISAAVQSYDPSVTPPNAQDWPRWCREKWVDFVCPMDYTSIRFCLKNMVLPQKPVMDATGVPIYPGIGVYSGRSRLDALSAANQILLLRELGFAGYTFFSFRADTYPEFDALALGPMRPDVQHR